MRIKFNRCIKFASQTYNLIASALILNAIAILVFPSIAIAEQHDQNYYLASTKPSKQTTNPKHWYHNHRFYAELKGGHSLNAKGNYNDGDADTDNGGRYKVSDENTIGNSLSYGSEIGFSVYPFLRVALSYDFFSNFNSGFDQQQLVNRKNTTADYSTYTAKASSQVFMLNSYLDFNGFKRINLGRFNPYIMAGIGDSINKLGTLTEQGVLWQGQVTTDGSTTNRLAWQLGFGSRYALSKNFYIDAGYRYLNLGGFESGTERQMTNSDDKLVPLKTPIAVKNVTLGQVYLGLIYTF